MLSILAATVLAQGTRLPAVRLGDQDFRPTLPTWSSPGGADWSELPAKLAAISGTPMVEWPIEVRVVESSASTEKISEGIKRFRFDNISGANLQGCLNEVALFAYLVKAYSGGRVSPKISLIRDKRLGPLKDELPSDTWSRFVISPDASGGAMTFSKGPTSVTPLSFYRFYDPAKPGSVARVLFNQWVVQVCYRANHNPSYQAPDILEMPNQLVDFGALVPDDLLKAAASGNSFEGTVPRLAPASGLGGEGSLKMTFEPGEAEKLVSVGGSLASAKDESRGNVAAFRRVNPASMANVVVLGDARPNISPDRKVSFWVKADKGADRIDISKADSGPLFGEGARLSVDADGQWHRVILHLSANDRMIGLTAMPVFTTDEKPAVPIYFDDFVILDPDKTEPSTPMLAVRPAPDSRSPDEMNRLYWIANLSDDLAPLQIAELRSMIGDPSFDVRLNAIEKLSKLKIAEALPEFTDASMAINPSIAEVAINGLAAIGTEEANAILKARLRGPYPHSRRYAIRALAKPGDESLVKEFSLAVAITDIALREEAARGMAILGTPLAMRTGAAFLNDGDFRVRCAFLSALPPSAPIDPRRIAQAMTEDPDPRVRAHAAAALLRNDQPAARAAAAKFADEKSMAARFGLFEIPRSQTEEMKAMATKFTSDPNARVREAATNYLGKA